MNEELKPCPFCGKSVAECKTCAEAELLDELNEIYPEWNKKFCVVCNFNKGGCGSSTGAHDTPEDAIKAWNRRTNNG